MKILAIESSCDETAAAVVEDGRRVRSSVVASQAELHARYGGVVPEVASRRHLESIAPLTAQALEQAGLSRGEVDAVAVTSAPGLIGALLVGINFAKSYALALGLPLIPVHHIRAHIAAAYLAEPGLEPPFLAAVISGGHTLLIDVEDYTKMRVLGSTRDDAAGEAFDKAARVMGLGYPGGAALSKLAESGDPSKYELPLGIVRDSELDMSFSGVKTALVNIVHNAGQRGIELDLPSLAASFERAVCDAIVPRAAEALKRSGRESVVLAGGVAANARLRAALTAEFGKNIHIPPVYLCGDNAAMVGSQAYYEYMAGTLAGSDLNGVASCPADSDRFALCNPRA